MTWRGAVCWLLCVQAYKPRPWIAMHPTSSITCTSRGLRHLLAAASGRTSRMSTTQHYLPVTTWVLSRILISKLRMSDGVVCHASMKELWS